MDKLPSSNNTVTHISGNKSIQIKLNIKDNQVHYDSTQGDVSLLEYKSNSRLSRCFKFFTSLTVEPVMFLFIAGLMINLSCLPNLIMDKGCLYYYNYTAEICKNISAYPEAKTNLEKLSNNYMLYSNVLSLVAASVMIFIAPWSDKYGRKLPLILCCIGTILSDVGTLLWVLNFKSNIAYCVLIRIPSEITGGVICFLTIVYSHVADVTSDQNRTMKYTTVQISMILALSIGGLIGGELLKYYGFFYVYLAGNVLHFTAVLWIIFVLEETIVTGRTVSWTEKRRNFFRSDSVSKSWRVTVKHRENNGRVKIWMYFLSTCIVVLTYEAFTSLGYTYAHHIYDWDPSRYNIVNTIFSLFQFGIMLILVPLFLKVFKLSDPVIGIMGFLSMMAKNIFLGFAKYEVGVYYIGNAAGALTGFAILAMKAGLSKIADKEETGLIFSFLATLEQVFPIVGTALVTKVFNETIDIFPSVSYLMAAAFLFIPLIIFV